MNLVRISAVVAMVLLLLSGAVTPLLAACPFGDSLCTPEHLCRKCAEKEEKFEMPPLPPVDSGSRLVTLTKTGVSYDEMWGTDTFPEVTCDISIQLVFPIRGGQVFAAYLYKTHVPANAPPEKYAMLKSTQDFFLGGKFTAGDGFSFSARGRGSRGGIETLSGTLKPEGKGVLKLHKIEFPVTFATFPPPQETSESPISPPTTEPSLPSSQGESATPEGNGLFGSPVFLLMLGLCAAVSGYLLLRLLGLVGGKPADAVSAEPPSLAQPAPQAIFNEPRHEDAPVEKRQTDLEAATVTPERRPTLDQKEDRREEPPLESPPASTQDRGSGPNAPERLSPERRLPGQFWADTATAAWEARVEFSGDPKHEVKTPTMPDLAGLSKQTEVWATRTAYTVISGIGGEITQEVIQAGTVGENAVNGVKTAGTKPLKGGMNLLVGEGVNAMEALASRFDRDVLHATPLRLPESLVPNGPVFHDSIPLPQLSKIHENYPPGTPLRKILEPEAPDSTFSRAFDLVSGKEFPTPEQFRTVAGYERALDNLEEMRVTLRENAAWKAIGLTRGQIVDQEPGNRVNDAIFGKGT